MTRHLGSQGRSALLLIEFQQEWLSEKGKLHHLMTDKADFVESIGNAKKIVAATRQTQAMPIIHSGLCFTPDYQVLGRGKSGLRAAIPAHQTFLANAEGSQFPAPFTPQENEFLVAGRIGSSAFAGSNLDNYLRHNQIQTLYLMGYALHVCVESTLRAAHDLGYETILIEDAAAAFTAEQKKYVLNEIVHHFGTRITTADYLKTIYQEAQYA